jgi:hypothetical protein
VKLSDEARELFGLLWPKGSGYSYYWHRKASTWFDAGAPGDLPASHDVYFGLNLVAEPGGQYERGKIATTSHLTALFAEFDDTQFGGDPEFTRWYVERLKLPPSAAVRSGGGIHCYWPMLWPTPITDDNRASLNRLQKRWVSYVGADPGAADLARCPRVPGTLNSKYDPARPVALLWADQFYYDVPLIEQHLSVYGPPEKVYTPPAAPILMPTRGRTLDGDRARAYGLAALDRELAAISSTGKGGRNARLNEAALKLGALAAGGALDHSEVARALYHAALALGTDESFTDASIKATIRSGLAAGLKQPRGVPNAVR